MSLLPQDTPQTPAPLIAGKYRMVRRLAVGGMAEIWLATDPGHRPVVVKLPLPHVCRDRGLLAMFEDEAALAMQLQHPNLVRAWETGTHRGRPFMVMDYVQGCDVRALLDFAAQPVSGGQEAPGSAAGLALGALSIPEVVALAEGLAQALAALHGAQSGDGTALEIVHRDVSPHNVLVDRFGAVKLLDLGVARTHQRSRPTTVVGTLKGKVAYMAPEQAAGAAVDARCDQFAWAAVVWECLVGRPLFEAFSEGEILAKVLQGQVRRPSSAIGGGAAVAHGELVAGLEAVLMRSLELEVGSRFASMEQAAAAWLAVAGAPQEAQALLEVGRQGLASRVQAQQAAAKGRTCTLAPMADMGMPVPAARGGDGVGRVWAWVLPWLRRKRLHLLGLAGTAVVAVVTVALVAGLFGAGLSDGNGDGEGEGTRDAERGGVPAGLAKPPPFGAGPPVEISAASSPVSAGPAAKGKPSFAHLPQQGVPDRGTEGTLSMRSAVWLKVYLGTELLGETPLRARVPAGKRTYRLVNEPLRIDKSVTLNIGADALLQYTLTREDLGLAIEGERASRGAFVGRAGRVGATGLSGSRRR